MPPAAMSLLLAGALAMGVCMAARTILFALPLLLAGCMAPPKLAAPAPVVTPPPPVVAPPPPGAPLAWTEAPVAVGGWHYARDAAGSVARFGLRATAPGIELRCDLAARSVSLSRPSAAAGRMTVTTSYGVRSFPAEARAGGLTMATLPARDPFLDQLAFSRARFAVEGPAPAPRLILPVWAEPTRVIEDCRA